MEVKRLLQTHHLLSDRVRLACMVTVASTKEPIDFNSLLTKLELVTKGNLSVHLKKLEGAGLIKVTKEFIDRKPRTTYKCTKEGRQEIKKYLEELEYLLKSSLKKSKL